MKNVSYALYMYISLPSSAKLALQKTIRRPALNFTILDKRYYHGLYTQDSRFARVLLGIVARDSSLMFIPLEAGTALCREFYAKALKLRIFCMKPLIYDYPMPAKLPEYMSHKLTKVFLHKSKLKKKTKAQKTPSLRVKYKYGCLTSSWE